MLIVPPSSTVEGAEIRGADCMSALSEARNAAAGSAREGSRRSVPAWTRARRARVAVAGGRLASQRSPGLLGRADLVQAWTSVSGAQRRWRGTRCTSTGVAPGRLIAVLRPTRPAAARLRAPVSVQRCGCVGERLRRSPHKPPQRPRRRSRHAARRPAAPAPDRAGRDTPVRASRADSERRAPGSYRPVQPSTRTRAAAPCVAAHPHPLSLRPNPRGPRAPHRSSSAAPG